LPARACLMAGSMPTLPSIAKPSMHKFKFHGASSV
jgi:hypothetical protein